MKKSQTANNANLFNDASSVRAYVSAFCPTIPTRVRKAQLHSNPKWFNQNIKAQIRKEQISLPLQIGSFKCRLESHLLTVLQKNEACNLQPKLLFNYINSHKTWKDSIKVLLDADGCFQTDNRVNTSAACLVSEPVPSHSNTK